MAKLTTQTLGSFLRIARDRAGLSLRGVEEETGISNAYLSQLEGEKIKQPSPVVLYKLSEQYRVPYSSVMKLAGYPVPEPLEEGSFLHARVGSLTEEEEDAVVDFVEFMRSKRTARGRR